MGILYQTESFLTACISLVHEPDKPWPKQWPSCRNWRKELRRNCLPIGHNNTKHFLCPIRSQHSLDRLEMVRWESVPRGSSACAWKLSSRLFSRPDWLPLGLRGWKTPYAEVYGPGISQEFSISLLVPDFYDSPTFDPWEEQFMPSWDSRRRSDCFCSVPILQLLSTCFL